MSLAYNWAQSATVSQETPVSSADDAEIQDTFEGAVTPLHSLSLIFRNSICFRLPCQIAIVCRLESSWSADFIVEIN